MNRPCSRPGCTELVPSGYCAAHTPTDSRYRGSSNERGYDGAWRRFRKWFINGHPICEDCGRYPTTDVHHVKKLADFPELRLVESNCSGLCHGCHSAITAKGG